MKKRRLHTAIWIILGSALLFNQAGLNFFHDRHNAHEYFEAARKGQSMLLNHGEHCQVCSLEVLFTVVLPVATEIPVQRFDSQFSEQICPEPVFTFLGRACGRAPPRIA